MATITKRINRRWHVSCDVPQPVRQAFKERSAADACAAELKRAAMDAGSNTVKVRVDLVESHS